MTKFRSVMLTFILAIVICLMSGTIKCSSADEETLEEAERLHAKVVELYKAGKYTEAVLLAEQVVEIMKKTLGEKHLTYAASLNNLAGLYMSVREYSKAEPLFRQAMEIVKKTLGEKHLTYTTMLNNFGFLYKSMGEYSKAEPLYRQGMEIRKKVLGEEHPDYAASLINLAGLYWSMGEYSKAEPLCRQAMEIRKKTLGDNHPDYASSLNNLAELYGSMGQYSKAEPLFKQAMEILKKVLGENHPDYATSLNNLAFLKVAIGMYPESLEFFDRASQIEDKQIEDIFSFTSEKGRFRFLETVQGQQYAFLSLCIKYMKENKDAKRAGLGLILRRKGIVLESILEEKQALRLSNDPKLREKFEELKQTKGMLARHVFSGIGKQGTEAYRMKITEIENKIEELEREIARLSAIFRVAKESKKVDVYTVVQKLASGEALIDIARYRVYNFKAKGKEPKWGNEEYAAFILCSGKPVPDVVELGKAEDIDNMVKKYQDKIEKSKESISQGKGKESEQGLTEVMEPLYREVWAKIDEKLCGAKKVYISPDGELNFVSFGSLMGKDGRYLVEDYEMCYIASGRDLMRRLEPSGRKLVAFGDPAYGGSSTYGQELLITRQGVYRSIIKDRGAFGGLKFPQLPGTRQEVSVITKEAKGRGWEVKEYTGDKASEACLKLIERPGILHLATHGFFLSDTGWQEDREDETGISGRISMESERGGKASSLELHNPMHRSGIALSGANLSIEGGATEDREDGLVTAEEASSLGLEGTRVVVLSTCESGGGKARSGEGVMGLRRGFVQAGAQGLVMALWSVPDEETQDIINRFYKKYLGTDGVGVVESLTNAQREFINTHRAEGKTTHPYLWSAFVGGEVARR